MEFDYHITVPEAEAEEKKQEILKAFGVQTAPIASNQKYARFSLLIERNQPKFEEGLCSEDSV